MEDCYLEHHGIKGMRWGIRRFQNKDGSLTPAGRKRRVSGESSSTISTKPKPKTESKPRSSKSSKDSSGPKKPKDMSDEELRKAVNRLQMEKQYRDLYRDLNPQQISAGRRFVNASVNKVLVPAAQEAGKNIVKGYIEKEAKKRLGINVNKKDDKNKK